MTHTDETGGSGRVLTRAEDALIVVDVQRDFCPGGSLAVERGDEIIPVIDRLVPLFRHWVYTRDWHPADHVSFIAQGGPWPPHAVQGTPGADWCEGLEIPLDAVLVSKGDDPGKEAYSGFQVERLDLARLLRDVGVERVFITGLTTDYCVRQTALDARVAGFEVFLVEDAVKGVAPHTTERALADMETAGVVRVGSWQVRGGPAVSDAADDADDGFPSRSLHA